MNLAARSCEAATASGSGLPALHSFHSSILRFRLKEADPVATAVSPGLLETIQDLVEGLEEPHFRNPPERRVFDLRCHVALLLRGEAGRRQPLAFANGGSPGGQFLGTVRRPG